MKNWDALGVPKASSGQAAGGSSAAPGGSDEIDVSKLEPPSLVPKKQEAETNPKPTDKPKLPGLL